MTTYDDVSARAAAEDRTRGKDGRRTGDGSDRRWRPAVAAGGDGQRWRDSVAPWHSCHFCVIRVPPTVAP
ncbi:hypothetical protein ABT300_08165 [Streptomyces sp. NPDC001027]|uniref:hypothetical protein n=1 Tax=Streptomyces sp. NPDC001027 TaxID=3154771 RepID=UPI003333E684